MLRYCSEIYFILCIIILVNCSAERDNMFKVQKSYVTAIDHICYLPTEPCNEKNGRRQTTRIYCCISETCDKYKKINGKRLIGIYSCVPSYMMMGIYLSEMFLSDPLVEVEEDIFNVVTGLEEFKVHESAIKIIPDFRFVRNVIKVIAINTSRLTSLEGENLQGLHSLKELIFCHNHIQFIDPDVFMFTDNVEYINLSYNNLTFIPPKLLDSMKKLHFFSASHNNLLHIDHVFSVVHPKVISLDFNNITSGNRIMSFDNYSAPHGSQFLEDMDIELLDLSYNSIEIVPSHFCYSEGNENTTNSIKFCRISQLRLVGNEIQNLTSHGYGKILKLDISRNQIQYLTDRDFIFILNTISLELQKNRIQRIGTRTFASIKSSLSYLDLSMNKISSINGSMKHLSQLKSLNLAYNSIQVFAKDEFAGVHQLSELHLQNNQIRDVGVLQQFKHLEYLDISYNAVESIRPFHVPKDLRKLILAGNPFKCDCYLQPFIDLLKANDLLVTDTGVCSVSDIGHKIPRKRNCPELCSCRCTNYKGVSFMFVDCSSRNLSVIPQLFRDNIAQMENNQTINVTDWRPLIMEQDIYPSLHIEDVALGISLENNNLVSLYPFQLPPNLTLLYLSNNKLEHFFESVFDNQQNLQGLSLSWNPWKCDCNALKFKKWLTSKIEIVRDADNILCGESDEGNKILSGKVLWMQIDDNFCPAIDLTPVLTASFGALSFVISCFLLYAKYELNIKVFLYYHGLTFVKEEDLDYDKEFDAFLSFSHIDDKFVIKEIISVIKKQEPIIRLCFSQCHFMPGRLIMENVTLAVQNSKRTVFFLTKDFFESEWCLLEFKAAHEQVMDDKVPRIILIKVGDLPKEVDPMINLYLKSTTYLSWKERNFWKKFLFILPTSCNVRNPVPRHTCYENTVFNHSSV